MSVFAANPIGIVTVLAILFSWALAIVLYRTSERGTAARQLALLLVVEGFTLLSSTSILFIFSAGLQLYESQPWINTFGLIVHFFFDSLMIALYPPFLAAALNTPLTRPFARKGVVLGWWAYSAAIYLFTQFVSEEIGVKLISFSLVGVFAYALVAASHSWLNSRGQARTRALIFILAFGFRDLCWTYIYLMQALSSRDGPPEDAVMMSFYIIYSLGTFVAVPLIAYGILKTQLFDIDLKIRWTIKQSTFAAMVVAIAAVLSEGVEYFVSSELGETWGLVAAGVALLFIKPLQNIAERVVSLVMPNTKNTEEYKTSRKHQVYEAAFAEAVQADGISERERALLVRLRDSLEISEAEAERIEHEVVNAMPANASFA